MRLPRLTSLRQRFLLIVLAGAVLPLGLLGWWLTRSAVRSAEGRLRAQLDSTLSVIEDGVRRRWAVGHGEIALLADNEVVRRTLSARVWGATRADSAFMKRLFATLRRSVVTVRYIAADGSSRWGFASHDTDRSGNDDVLPGGLADDQPATFLVRVPIESPVGTTHRGVVGQLVARVRLASVLYDDSTVSLVAGSHLGVVDRATNAIVQDPRNGGDGWLEVKRSLDQPALDLSLAVPSAPYVRPFEQAARLGFIALLIVAAIVVALTAILTSRVTRSLEMLTSATTAVAHGDIDHVVPVRGDDEAGRLAASFNVMTDSLRKTVRELAARESLAAVGEFATTLSHDVRNALSAIRVDLQRAEERIRDRTAAWELVSRALLNMRRLDSTVTGSLQVARGGRGTLEQVDLRAVLIAAATAAEPTFRDASGVLETEAVAGEPVWIDGDAGALEHLFLNLLINAGQALSAGGRASLGLMATSGSVVVTIADTGTGMAPAQLARVGELFYTSKRGGTGLGLTIAQKIAAAHGGRVEIKSEAGRGTTVSVILPVQPARSASS